MKFIQSVLLSLVFFISPALVAAENQPYENQQIEKIEISIGGEENKTQEASIRARMKTKEGALFSQADFDEDLKVLSKEFDHIDSAIDAQSHKLVIQMKCAIKPTIHATTFVGNKAVPTDKLQKELDIKVGATFDRSLFNKAFHKLKNYYVKKGYFEAELDYNIKKDEKMGGVEIVVDIKEGRSGHIKELRFTNFTKKEQEELTELMLTKEYCFFTSWFSGEGTHKAEVFRHDELTVLNYLHNEGYADAKIETVIHETKGKDYIILEIIVDKGVLYHFGDVAIDGEKLFSKEQLMKLLPFKKGEPYSPEKVRDASRIIFDTYGKKGYIDALITPDVKVIADQHVYNVQITIVEGDRYRVGLIKVFGNTKTEASVILHESLLTPGEVFDTTLLNKTEERLKNIGFFTNVNVYAVKSKTGESATGKSANFRDVFIEVEENPTTASFRTYVGYSTSERLMGGFSVSESNFNSKGIPYMFTRGLKSLRGGGEYLGLETVFGTRQQSYTISWTKPYFLDTTWTVGMDLSKSRNSYSSNVNDYFTRAYSAQLFASYPINAFMKLGTHYRLTHSFIKLKNIHHKKRNDQLIHESKNGGLISAAGATLSYNSTNHPVLPTKGLKSSLGAEFAGLGGDHTFLQLAYLNTNFWSPYKGAVLRMRGNVKFIKTMGSTHPRDLPFAERYYLGGEQTLRGYHFNSVGPKFHDKRRTARGGVSEVLLSADYTQYLFKKLDAFVFFDAGNVYFQQFHVGTLRASYGYGIKIKLNENAAPLVIGYGYPINPQRKEDVKHFFLTFGASF